MTDPGFGQRRSTFRSWHLALGVVFLAALALRLYGLDWDDGADLHPDELFIAKIVLIDRIHFDWPPDLARLFDPARSGLNPRSADPATGQFREFAYGALPLWVTDLIASILSQLTGTNWNGIDNVYLVGRSLSALLSALTILPIARLGAVIGGRAVGLLAALFAALAPMSIQLAHFFTTDSWLTFFVAIALLACVAAAREGGAWRFAAAGAAVGLAMATKGSVFALVAPVATALAINAYRASSGTISARFWRTFAGNALASAAAAMIAFSAFEPFALLRLDVYLRSLRTQADIVSGRFDVPFTRVYAGTTPFLYQIEQFIRWGYGPAAGLLALVGIGLIAKAAARRGSTPALIVLSWAVTYSAVLAFSDVKFLRYLEPLAPVFAVGAALALVRVAGSLGARRWSLATNVVTPVALILSVAWTGAFVSIYAHENPRLAATKWIYATLPPGSALTAEYWDDALPRAIAYAFTPSAYGYEMALLDSYRDLLPDGASAAIFDGLTRADYVVHSSGRVEAAVRAAPWRYPVQGRFFDELERGSLGYRPILTLERAPAIGNVTIDDRLADESFINYDHPRVAIFERVRSLSRSDYDNLMAWALRRPWYPDREPPKPTLLLDTPVGENPAVNDARWSAAWTSSTPAAIAILLLLILVLAAVGLPIARLAFSSFPDHGWGLARTIALVVAAYPVWLGASLQIFSFRAIWAVLALAVFGVIGWWLTVRNRRERTPLISQSSSRGWLHAEAAFWLVFAIFLVFRLINPDSWHPLWGGEKPMEFALINAIGRSAYFPPYDPWYADGYVNYYYYGFYLISFLLKATGIPTEIGFNLALPTVMAMLASGSFSVAAALSGKITRSSRLATLGGWIAVVATCLIGNLTSVRGLLAAGASTFDPFIFWTWNGSRSIENVITEFPYFTGLYADLHAHVVALPMTVVAIALCLSLATSKIAHASSSGAGPMSALAPLALRIALLALILGSLWATNAWDVPVYVALAVASVFMATSSISPWPRRYAIFAAISLAIAGSAWLLFAPFHRHFVPLFSKLALVQDPTDLLQFLSHFGGLIAICSFGLTVLLVLPGRNPREGLVLPMVSVTAGLAGIASLSLGTDRVSRTVGEILICLAFVGPPLATAWLWSTVRGGTEARRLRSLQALALLAGLAILASLLMGRSVLGLSFALGVAAAIGWLQLRRPADRFVCLLVAAAFFTAGGAEIVVVADDLIDTIAYRMNTVFKFYNQVWILLSLAASSLVALMARDAMVGELARSAQTRVAGRMAWSRVGLALAIVLLTAASAYPILATGPRLAQRFEPGTQIGSLNAFGWMQEGTVPVFGSATTDRIGYSGDAAAITWLLNNVEGTPVIAEASIGPYRCNGSRISSATGLPTIIGWERHEQQQRYPETLPPRVRDVRLLYTSRDVAEKASILYRYNVEYVIVGDLERVYPIANNECLPDGSAAGIAAFDEMVGDTLEIAHSEAGTTIYRVLPVGGET